MCYTFSLFRVRPLCFSHNASKRFLSTMVLINSFLWMSMLLFASKEKLHGSFHFFPLFVLAALPVGISKNFTAWQREEVTSLYPQIIQLSAACPFFCCATLHAFIPFSFSDSLLLNQNRLPSL